MVIFRGGTGERCPGGSSWCAASMTTVIGIVARTPAAAPSPTLVTPPRGSCLGPLVGRSAKLAEKGILGVAAWCRLCLTRGGRWGAIEPQSEDNTSELQ